MGDVPSAAAAVDSVRRRIGDFRPEVFIGLGSGLGEACRSLEPIAEIPFGEIPGFAPPTVVGHAGKAVFGRWGGRNVLALLGRMHLYEGHSVDHVVLPIRVAAGLGVRTCILTNMSGGLVPEWRPPSLVVMEGHLDLRYGIPRDEAGVERKAYGLEIRRSLMTAAERAGLKVNQGAYVGVLGPNYETPAEIRAFRQLGAHVVGMSTVAEALEAARLGLSCGGVSCIANFAAGVVDCPISHAEVLEAAAELVRPLGRLLDEFLRNP